MKYLKKWLPLFLFCLVISLFFQYPYLFSDNLNLEHDTFFHLSRIEGLAQNIKEGQFLPSIYPYKNGGFGYGNALFYSDFFLFIPALLYLAGMSIASCYKILIFLASFFSALTMGYALTRISRHQFAPYLGAFLYLFSNYRITDVYVRGAVGEVIAFIFLPLILLGVFAILQKRAKESILWLTIGFTGLVLSHNITFFLGCILFASFLLLNIKEIFNKECILSILSSVLLVIGLTAFFTFGMIEQMMDHTMIVHYYGTASDLASTALCAWQFFINQTVFGLAGNTGDPASIMVTNPGWFLTFVPMARCLIINKKRTISQKLIHQSTLLGFLFLFLCSGILPWKHLTFLSILQFPWRFMTLAVTLLSIPAATVLFDLFKKHRLVFLLSLTFCIINSIWLLQPVFDRTFVIAESTKYEDILNGSIVDPYYSATYMRVELAGGDYLPWPTVDYRGYAPAVRSSDGTIIQSVIHQKSTELAFEVNTPQDSLIVPLTWYKGYQGYWQNEKGEWIQLQTSIHSDTGLTQLQTVNTTGNYMVVYERTIIQNIGLVTTLLTLAATILYSLKGRA